MVLIEYIMGFYEYIASIVCPFVLKHLQSDEYVDDTDNNSLKSKSVRFHVPCEVSYPINSIESEYIERNIENTTNPREDLVEPRDHFDEYTKLITITDRQVYKHNYNYYSDSVTDDNVNVNSSPFKRARSYSVNHYYCGYCSQIITTPEFMYQDKPFCNIRCRNNRIASDNKNKVREHHSFSI